MCRRRRRATPFPPETIQGLRHGSSPAQAVSGMDGRPGPLLSSSAGACLHATAAARMVLLNWQLSATVCQRDCGRRHVLQKAELRLWRQAVQTLRMAKRSSSDSRWGQHVCAGSAQEGGAGHKGREGDTKKGPG
jgi:hypothetical protein